jgi:hypothetical protein
MTLIGFAGLVLALAAMYIADIRGSRRRLSVFMLLLALHTEASGSDSHFYFYDPLQLYGRETGLGTLFILNMVQTLKENLGGEMLDHYMLFNAIGFWGVAYLFKAVNEIFEEVEAHQPSWVYLPLFLPGIHFWTGAIGKDAPLFFAVSLAVWGSLRFNQRLPALGVAATVMLAVRPHVAIIALMAVAFAALFQRQTKLWIKLALVLAVIGSAGTVASTIQTTYRLDVSSAESIGEFLASRGSINEASGADLSIVEGSLPMKVFSLWLRPFFVDAENAMGYVASAENAVLLAFFLAILWNWRTIVLLAKRVGYIRFCLVFFLALTALLSAVNFNVGLGLRQKMMAMPCLLVLLAALAAVRLSRLAQAREAAAVDYQAQKAIHLAAVAAPKKSST